MGKRLNNLKNRIEVSEGEELDGGGVKRGWSVSCECSEPATTLSLLLN